MAHIIGKTLFCIAWALAALWDAIGVILALFIVAGIAQAAWAIIKYFNGWG